MNFPKKTLLGSLLLFSATSAFAVDTADLRVIGTIAPTACTPTFAGGGVVDYGNIPTASLSRTDATLLATHTISYTITCDAPIAIGTSWSDGRSGSASIANLPVGFSAASAFGLGKQGSADIGRYVMEHASGSVTGDGVPVSLIIQNNGAAWATSPINYILNGSGVDRVYSYAPTGTLVPGAYTTVAGTINVSATIAPTSTLDLTNSITLDGLSTMTVRYL